MIDDRHEISRSQPNRSDSDPEPFYFSDSGTTLVYNTDVFQTAKKRGSSGSAPQSKKKAKITPIIDLAGEEFCSAEIDVEEFKLSVEKKEELLSCTTAQKLCIDFFATFGMKVTPQIRTEGKRRFCRVSLNHGEYIFEESLDSSLLGRVIASLKAVRAFNPDLVSTWLQKYKKIHTLTKGCFI